MNSEDIIKRRPVNKVAVNVTGPGVHYDNPGNNGDFVSEAPLPVKDCDLTNEVKGKHFGRLTVFGLSATENGKYVCQCQCGRYCLRKIKRLREAAEHQMCSECHHHENLIGKDYYRRTGKDRT